MRSTPCTHTWLGGALQLFNFDPPCRGTGASIVQRRDTQACNNASSRRRDVIGSDNLFSERFAALEVLPGVVAHMGVPGSGWWGRKEHVDWSTWGDWPQGGCPHVIQCGAGRKAKEVCWSKCES